MRLRPFHATLSSLALVSLLGAAGCASGTTDDAGDAADESASTEDQLAGGKRETR